MKISQWMAALGLLASVALAGGSIADAAPAVPVNGPTCTQGAIAIITDSSGIQQEACVAVAAEPSLPAAPPSGASLISASTVRTTSSAPASPTLPSTGIGTGGLIIALVLVVSGSVVSLISRRRPIAPRKGFRGRRATP